MGDDPNRRGNSRRWIIRAVEDSLRRLGTDWIDLYQVHRPDPTPTSRRPSAALTDLVHQGKVRYIGSSTFPASQIVEAQWVARDRHLQRFVTEQPPYSILVRGIEADVLPTCARHGMGVIPYSPLAGGWLSGRWRKDAGQQPSSRAGRLPERFDLSLPANQRKLDAVEQLAQLAEEAGITLIQLAIAFVLNHPAVTAPIIGPRTMEQLESQLAAADVVLDAGRAGPHRRDRPARHDHQPGRQLLPQPRPRAGGAPTARSIMRYRRLGSSDLEVSEISLGSWLTFAGGVGFELTSDLHRSRLRRRHQLLRHRQRLWAGSRRVGVG